jgi:hypothetical protein
MYMTSRTGFAVVLLTLAAANLSPARQTIPSSGLPSPSGIEAKSKALLVKWKDRFDAEHFNASIAGPFVIAGDGSPARIARYRDNTVVAAQRALRAMYFTTEPDEPVLILLFERA